MSKLERFIKRCRQIWEELYVEPAIMDEIIDTFIKVEFDLDKITDEDIKLSTQTYINTIIKERIERKKNETKDG